MLKSRLARRFFAMFVACALIPIVALAILSYRGVTRQLTDQAFDRLRKSAKSHGLSIYENLLLAKHQLDVVTTLLDSRKGADLSSLPPTVLQRNMEVFTGIVLLDPVKPLSSWGKTIPTRDIEAIRRVDLAGQDSVLVVVDSEGAWPAVVIVRKIGVSRSSPTVLAGIIAPSFLWGLDQGSSLPPATEFSVVDDRGRCLFSSFGRVGGMDRLLQGDRSKPIELAFHGKKYYASSKSLFLKGQFHVPSWSVTVLESQDHVLEAIQYFTMTFPLIMLLSLVVVVWLSHRAIRRSLVPIESLMEGARQVADRHFDHRVVVTSKDEFQDLAVAFNAMAGQLDNQFRTLAARADLDSAVLSVLDLEKIIATSLCQSALLFPFRIAAISILESDKPMHGRSFVQEKGLSPTLPTILPFHLTSEEQDVFLGSSRWLQASAGSSHLPYLRALERTGVARFVVLPIWIQDRLFGLLSLGTDEVMNLGQPDLEEMRAFCDHLAVAFSNSNLVAELKELNMGTLQALARTVDAKSPWTAGHSLRVARMAVRIGTAMALSGQMIEDLERASLLHDIGKISIPLTILDKDGKLTAEEYDLIKGHPSTGTLILNPIKAYAGIIPMVEQHHERFDGKGYPYGLKGDEIHRGARIMAVADSYDAMVSDRPYRKALGRQRAIEIISQEAGLQFDPSVVEAFSAVIENTDDTIDSDDSVRFRESRLLPVGHIRFGQYVRTSAGEWHERGEVGT